MLTKNHLNRDKIGCSRSHIFSCLLIITVFLSPSCSQVRLRGTKFCPLTYFGHIQLKKTGKKLIIRNNWDFILAKYINTLQH